MRTQAFFRKARHLGKTLGQSLAIVVAALCTVGPAPASAQERVAFRHLTIADGLSQNAVSAIVQDRRGFMWFGTKDGLDRYDGYQFVVFRHDPFDSTSISDSGRPRALLIVPNRRNPLSLAYCTNSSFSRPKGTSS